MEVEQGKVYKVKFFKVWRNNYLLKNFKLKSNDILLKLRNYKWGRIRRFKNLQPSINRFNKILEVKTNMKY